MGPAVQNKSLDETLTREIAIAMVMGIFMISVILCLTTTSWFEPFLFLFIMGVAIIINMGTNIFLGEISFLTFSTAAILQLAIAMDYSVFLLHSFTRERQAGVEPEQAVANAIHSSVTSILSSGATTIVGFLVLMLMRFKIGFDMGFVLAKGIVISLLTVLLLMPALLLRWGDKIEKTAHRSFMPSFKGLGKAVFKIRYGVLILVALLVVPRDRSRMYPGVRQCCNRWRRTHGYPLNCGAKMMKKGFPRGPTCQRYAAGLPCGNSFCGSRPPVRPSSLFYGNNID